MEDNPTRNSEPANGGGAPAGGSPWRLPRRVAVGVLRAIGWTVAAAVAIVAAVALLLYAPFVQDALMPTVLRMVSDAVGMEITAGGVRLQWPLRVSVHDLRVVAAPGDTMVTLRRAQLQVEPLPLWALDVRAHCAAEEVEYRLGTPDSAICLRAVVDRFRLMPSSYSLRSQHIRVSNAEVDGGDVVLLINGLDTLAAPVDTAAPLPLTIEAERLSLRDVRFRMAMLPTIDSLDATVPLAQLRGGHLDMLTQTVGVRSLQVDSVSAAYFVPRLADDDIAAATVADTATTAAWTVTADYVSLTGRDALYAVSGAEPCPGLDMDYLRATAIDLQVDSFFNRGMEVRALLSRMAASERCGIKLDGSGRFAMDSTALRAENFKVSTIYSEMAFDAMLGMGDFTTDPSLPLSLLAHGEIGIPDVALAMPDLQPLLAALPDRRDLSVEANLDGTVGDLSITRLALGMRDHFTLAASGRVADGLDINNISGYMNLDGEMPNLQFAKAMALTPAMANEIAVPPIVLTGTATMRRGAISGDLAATVDSTGEVLLRAAWNGRSTDYAADLQLNRFPVASIMPGLGVGDATATLVVDGHGMDTYAPSTRLRAEGEVVAVTYNHRLYEGIRLWADLDSGDVSAGLLSTNRDASLSLAVDGTLANGGFDLALDGDVRNLDLRALGLADDECRGSLSLGGKVAAIPDSSLYSAQLSINGLEWVMPDMELYTPAIDINFAASDSATNLALRNVGLSADFHAPCCLDTLAVRLADATTLAMAMTERRRVAIDTLQAALPPFALDVNASGSENLLGSVLAASDMSVGNLRLALANDTAFALAASATAIRTTTTRVDTVKFLAEQHGSRLDYRAAMNNRPGTLDDFAHVAIDGHVAHDGLSAHLDQQNADGATGYRLGADLAMTDTTLTLCLAPLDPVIAYKGWTLNADNHITLDLAHRHLAADLRLAGDAGGRLAIYTRNDTLAGDVPEKLMVTASGIEIADWLSLSPLSPPISGVAGADIAVDWDVAARSLLGRGKVMLDSLCYDGQRVGSFLLAADATTDTTGAVRADASLIVDGERVLTAYGVVDRSLFADTLMAAAAPADTLVTDSTAVASGGNAMDMGLTLTRLPLRLVNPMMPPGSATMEGTLSGEMRMGGTLDAPLLNGHMRFDSAAVKVDMIGTRFAFAADSIPIDSSIVRFDHYAIRGNNDKPLYVDGTVDLRSLTSPTVNLALAANNMQVVDSRRSSRVDVYGKAFIDVDAKVRGNLNFMRVDATLALLPGSNVTYVMDMFATDLSTLSPDDEEMVRFVNFSDPEVVLLADTVATTGMALLLDARLVVDNGTTIGVDLSSSGSDRVQIQGAGALTFTMNPFSDVHLTGRYTIDKGFVRYTPPLMTEKLFDFRSGSYIAFNGDMMNPVLDVKADDVIRANVSEEGRDSRLVDFIVSLSVGGTLEDMDVAFDLSTDDDLTISNELQSMSQSQRANQAMNMLLYNVYTGPGTKAGSALSANPLFAFLTSRLNTWAANTIQGVDISFGIDQYDRTADGSTSTATNYSYKVSKTLFNDRVKIVVGGNYSTDADTDENFSQNLINDISFEYMLNRTGTTYLRLFRHVGYEDILEGEVTQTGVGFVYKRKLRSLRDLFGLGRRRQPAANQQLVKPIINQPNEAQ